MLQAISIAPYYVALAHGDVSLYLWMGVISILVATPLLVVLIGKSGLVGAALCWLIINLCTLPFFVYLTHRRFVPGEAGRWSLREVGVPVLVVVPCVLIGRWLCPQTSSRVVAFCQIGTVWAVSITFCGLVVTSFRRSVILKVYRWYGSIYAGRT